jgi:hypothetical protein
MESVSEFGAKSMYINCHELKLVVIDAEIIGL